MEWLALHRGRTHRLCITISLKYKKTDEYDEYDFCIPYPDTDLLNLVNQWDTTNSAKKIPLYYKIQERVLSQKGLWINWEKQSLRILKK